MNSIIVDNVNQALSAATLLLQVKGKPVSPRGKTTLECPFPVATTYKRPQRRVLFHPKRDANPFFHFFEALWILAGRRDVRFLAFFNKQMPLYSDDGVTFHGAYGYRLRNHPSGDQIGALVHHLRKHPDSRRAVLQIWDAGLDLDTDTVDAPCNDLVMFKLRDETLRMTVCNRSNDMVWGAYGANVVQFSVLQEYIAAKLNAKLGEYTQFSDSFHVYPDVPFWRDHAQDWPITYDAYSDPHVARTLLGDGLWRPGFGTVSPFLLFEPHTVDAVERDVYEFFRRWDNDPEAVADNASWARTYAMRHVVLPMYVTWITRHSSLQAARWCMENVHATDWALACAAWLRRRAGC